MNRLSIFRGFAICRLALLGLSLVLSGCVSSSTSEDATDASVHIPGQRLAPCPSSPNCISSRDGDAPAWLLNVSAATAWPRIVAAVSSLARTAVVAEDGYYLHAESRSRLFGFIDDLELGIDEQNGALHFRSASRLGYSDLGVNQRRLDALYNELLAQQLVH